jgi:hypothetical protein
LRRPARYGASRLQYAAGGTNYFWGEGDGPRGHQEGTCVAESRWRCPGLARSIIKVVARRSEAVQALAGDEEKRGIVCEAVVADARQPRRDLLWLPVRQIPPGTPARTPHSSNFTMPGGGGRSRTYGAGRRTPGTRSRDSRLRWSIRHRRGSPGQRKLGSAVHCRSGSRRSGSGP